MKQETAYDLTQVLRKFSAYLAGIETSANLKAVFEAQAFSAYLAGIETFKGP